MKYLSDGDFMTEVDGEFVDGLMNEDGNKIMTYGHLEDDEMNELAFSYLKATGTEDCDSWFDQHVTVAHEWARLDGEQLIVLKPGETIDEFSAPITVLQF